MGTNTGTPGFDIDGQTYEFDTGDPDAPGIAPVTTDHGDVSVDHSKKDLSKPTKTTLAHYLSDLTNGKKGASKGTSNQYPIDVPSDPVAEVSISDATGKPTTLGDTMNSAHFSSRAAASGTEVFSNDLQARNFSGAAHPVVPDIRTDARTALQGFVKGKSATPGINGNNMLPGVGKNVLPGPIKSYTSAVLSANRFSDASLLAEAVSGLGNDASPGEQNTTVSHPRYGDVSMHRLAQVGTSLSLRAAQALNASSPGNNPTGGTQELATIIPSPVQLGVTQIDALVMQAADVLKSLTAESIPEADLLDIGSQSWGTLNSVDEKFWGSNSLGMNALAAALSSAIVVLFEGLGFIVDKIRPSSYAPQRNANGQYVLGGWMSDPPSSLQNKSALSAVGASFGVDVTDIGGTLNIRPTIFPLGQALRAGIGAFFGIDTSTLSSALTSAIVNSTDSPGFNIIIARTIIRSSIFIERAFSATFSSPDGGAALDNATNIVYQLSSSRLIKALNIFSMLGDATLSDPETANVSLDEDPGQMVKKSFMDAFPNNGPNSTIQKSRLQGSLKLAWSNNRAPSMYLIPDAVSSMNVYGVAKDGFNGALSTGVSVDSPVSDTLSKTKFLVQSADKQAQNGSRISAEHLNKLESQLDAEYVPFYFHDLRTNEVISFHAFLNTLTEDYTPTWETVDGFGRVDPVKIYKHTGRRIGLSFYVVATSEEDFNDMWVKINKLVTLAYPQYTKGRTLTNGQDTTFVQPFSQMIGASPLIRMRLGDLFRSNYSRFALARLFGAADGTLQLPGTGDTDPIKFSGVADRIKQFEVSRQNLASTPDPSNRFTVDAAGWKAAPSTFAGIGSPIASVAGVGPTTPQSPEFSVRGSDLQYFEFEIKGIDVNDQTTVCIAHLLDATAISNRLNVDTDTATKIHNALVARYDQTNDAKRKVIGPNGYSIPAAMLTPTRKTLESLMESTLGDYISISQQNIETLNAFLNPEKNALVKSFESVQGKGLAGVLESLNFDWHDKVTWEDKVGSKAPKMCKVTMSFIVIHDISPGIDWLGYNRSPIYPVGLAMKPGKR